MRNIRKIALRILLILCILILYEKAVRFAYEPYRASNIYRSRELKESQGSIDTLFCGTSTTYRGFSPEIWDSGMNGNSFNIATAGQRLSDTYTLLMQETKKNPVERVFLGVSPRMMTAEEIYVLGSAKSYDLLDGVGMKLKYLFQNHTLEEMLYLAYYPVRVDSYGELSEVKKNIAYKNSSEFKDNINPDNKYTGKGFLISNKEYGGKTYEHIEQIKASWSADMVNGREEESLYRIIEYCQEQEIEIILVYPPVTGKQIKSYGDVSEIHEYYNSIAEKYNIQFWDFLYYQNLIEEYGNDKFKDVRHMNRKGGEQFTQKLTDIYQEYQDGKDIKQYFLETCPYYQSNTPRE